MKRYGILTMQDYVFLQKGVSMKHIRSALIILCTFMLFGAFSMTAPAAEPSTEAAEPALNYTKLTLYKGQKKKLQVLNTDETFKWSISRPQIAKVGKYGKVTALKAGRATVTAKFGSTKLTCSIRVKNPQLTLSRKQIKLDPGETKHLKVKKLVGWNDEVTWKSSNKKVAIVSTNGTVIAKKTGTCVVSATANGVTANCHVTVGSPATLSLDQTSLYLLPGEFDALEATVNGSAPKSSYSWSSSNSKVVKVSPSGNTCSVTAVGAGTATITVKYGELKDTCSVIVVGSSGSTVTSVKIQDTYTGGYEYDYIIGMDSAGNQVWKTLAASAPAAQGYLSAAVKYANYVYVVTNKTVSVLNAQNGQPLKTMNLSVGASPVACVDNNGYLYAVGGLSGNPHYVYKISYADNKSLNLVWSIYLNSNFMEPYGPYVQGSYLYIFDGGYYYSKVRIHTVYGGTTYYK